MISFRPRHTISLMVGALLILIGSGCDILDVSNPNNLTEDQIGPTSIVPLANGAEAAVTRALGTVHGPYSTATGELRHIGSRNAWGQLDDGAIDTPGNEFSDSAYPYLSEAVWLTRTNIERMETFQENDNLREVQPLVRTYLYGAIAYTTTADVFDNFVLSNQRDASEPVGSDNMDSLYDQAITWLDRGISIAESNDVDQPSLATLYAMRARAKYSRALWQKLNPSVNTSSPLVNNSGAVADAQEALSRMSGDVTYELELISSSPGLVDGAVSVAFQINNRRELQFSERYIETNANNEFESVTFEDLISGDVHPYLQSFITSYRNQGQYADIPVVSQREMYLILAEAALAGNPNLDFGSQINSLRSLDDLPDFTGQVNARALLERSREVNLFLQGRRLADHYRFGDPAAQWGGNRDAPGTFFPITLTEIRSNPNLSQ
jgi:hypothetical protein